MDETGLQLLYIDGMGAGRRGLADLLHSFGQFRLIEAGNVPAALRLVSHQPVDLVLLGGCARNDRARENERVIRALGRWAPVVALVDGQYERAEAWAIEAGADDCLDATQLDSSQLLHTIRAAVIRRRRQADRRESARAGAAAADASSAHETQTFPSRAILNSIGDALLIIDERGIVTYLNSTAEALLQVPQYHALGRNLHDLVTVVDEEFGVLVDPVILSGERPPVSQPLFLTLPDGGKKPVQCSAWPLNQLGAGIHKGTILQIHDASELYKRLQKVSYDASHDPLTGVLNRREIYRRIERAMGMAREHHLEHSLIYFDLDGFKQVNDIWGHAAGDRLLREITRLLLETLRGRDSIGRLGGDEFVLLLEHCPVDHAVQVADQVRGLIRGVEMEGVAHTQVSASISVVPVGADCTDVDTLIHCADAACYQAKRKGKDCIEVSRPC